MRTVPFKEVYEMILRMQGLDPATDDDQDIARSIIDNVNSRVRRGWRYWPWPMLEHTEERAFRSIWNPTRQFRIVGENSQPDELYYIGDPLDDYAGAGYYVVATDAPGDPPPGTVPPGNDYFDELTLTDRFIAYDQTCRKPIGDVMGVYTGNPRISCPRGLYYHPSEKGIDVCYGGPTVFVRYRLKPETFSMVPYAVGKTYDRGTVVYHAPLGDCFVSLADGNGTDPSNTDSWRPTFFPEELVDYVTEGAFADCLRESDQSFRDVNELVLRRTRAQDADADAENSIYAEISAIQGQHQTFKYKPFRMTRWTDWWVCSPAWTATAGSVTTIDEACQTDSFVPSPAIPFTRWEYHPEVLSIDTVSLSLIELGTTDWISGSMVELVIGPSGARVAQRWQLLSGPADISDPGQKNPNDYNVVTNDKHWEKVS